MRHTLILAACLALAPLAQAAGVVDVSFKPADQLTDIGHGSLERERNVKALAEHFQSLAARLPDGQTLKVEVLDVNLAGDLRPTRRGDDVRVLRGAADWPALDLRWQLLQGGRTLSSGDERLADMAYLQFGRRLAPGSPLPYEARMIDRWFDERFGPAAAR